MVLGWTLKQMSDSQLLVIWDQMNDHGKRNFAILDEIRQALDDDEDLATFIEAQDGIQNKDCLLGLSDRCLYVGLKLGRGKHQLERLPFHGIIFGGFRRTRLFGRLDVWESGVERHFNDLNKDRMEFFSNAFFERHDEWHKQHPRIDESSGPGEETSSRLASELERIVDLWRQGVLNDEEFALAKRRLLM